MHRLLLFLSIIGLVCAAHRLRADPNDWFINLIQEDQAHDSHDHSGAARERENHTCCHRLAFDEDPATKELLTHVSVPYNHWWRTGATLLSVGPTLDGPATRLISINEYGLALDLIRQSRLYVRLQCAFPCCLEATDIVIPDGAAELKVSAGNATLTVDSWRFFREEYLPPGFRLVDALGQRRSRHEALWREKGERDRLRGLWLCDYTTEGIWISIESLSRKEAALAEIDVCFINHDMARGWETDLCEEL